MDISKISRYQETGSAQTVERYSDSVTSKTE